MCIRDRFNLLSVIEGRILNDGAEQVDRVSGVVTIALPQKMCIRDGSNPVQLLRAGSEGEREPRSKWILALLGAVCLAAGYIISLRTNAALHAIQYFFPAVILVIIGTYLVFIALSIVVLKALRKNRRYYYKTSHFATVSGLIYRMSRNAAGLASICILSTMVLVTVSTTVSLYKGCLLYTSRCV